LPQGIACLEVKFYGIISSSFLIGAAPAQKPLGGLPVPAFEHHRAAAGADAQDGGRIRSPNRFSLVLQSQFMPETAPPLPDKIACHGLHYSKVPAIFDSSGARPENPDQGRIPAATEKWPNWQQLEEALAKVSKNHVCHSDRSEESRISRWLRPFASLRVTKKSILQEPHRFAF